MLKRRCGVKINLCKVSNLIKGGKSFYFEYKPKNLVLTPSKPYRTTQAVAR
jgi:hypothetical protein